MKNNNGQSAISWLVILSISLLLFSTRVASADNDDFQNWGVHRLGDAWVYSAPGLERGKAFTISLFPAVDIGDGSRQAWFRRFIARDVARLGKVTRRGELRQDKNRILGGHEIYIPGWRHASGNVFFAATPEE